MLRNFDEEFLEKDMEFQIGGETLRFKYVRPEVIALWEDEDVPEKATEGVAWTDKRIKQFLENGSQEKWDELRAREDNPISSGQINALLRWLVEIQAARPTEQPSPSAPGRGRREASSTAASA